MTIQVAAHLPTRKKCVTWSVISVWLKVSIHNFMVKSKDNTSNRNLSFMNSNQIQNAVVFDKMVQTHETTAACELKKTLQDLHHYRVQ